MAKLAASSRLPCPIPDEQCQGLSSGCLVTHGRGRRYRVTLGTDDAVLVRSRAQLPVPVEFSQPPPAPDHSRSPRAHG
jgi:hypothetical protein